MFTSLNQDICNVLVLINCSQLFLNHGCNKVISELEIKINTLINKAQLKIHNKQYLETECVRIFHMMGKKPEPLKLSFKPIH